jgi:uncharacterized protein YndB with AHSA1/START domain
MAEQSVIHNTFVIERSYPTRPDRVFAAFAEAAKKRRWFAEGKNHDVEEFDASEAPSEFGIVSRRALHLRVLHFRA